MRSSVPSSSKRHSSTPVGVLGEQREVRTLAVPVRAQRERPTGPDRRHGSPLPSTPARPPPAPRRSSMSSCDVAAADPQYAAPLVDLGHDGPAAARPAALGRLRRGARPARRAVGAARRSSAGARDRRGHGRASSAGTSRRPAGRVPTRRANAAKRANSRRRPVPGGLGDRRVGVVREELERCGFVVLLAHEQQRRSRARGSRTWPQGAASHPGRRSPNARLPTWSWFCAQTTSRSRCGSFELASRGRRPYRNGS